MRLLTNKRSNALLLECILLRDNVYDNQRILLVVQLQSPAQGAARSAAGNARPSWLRCRSTFRRRLDRGARCDL